VKFAGLKGATAALLMVFGLAGCTRTAVHQLIALPPDPPSALAVIATQPAAAAGAVAGLATETARTGEHLAVVTGSGAVVSSATAPAPPTMRGPVPPPALSADPTQYQLDAHQHKQNEFTAALAADRGALADALGRRLASWAAAATAQATHIPADPGTPGVQPGISAAMSFFGSLQEAGVDLGGRRVLVIFGWAGMSGSVPSLRASELTGVTVIVANFPGDVTAQQEWQAALLQAGAARAIVLTPAAASQVGRVTSLALAGQGGPAPSVVYFALNQDQLSPAARALLRRVAAELNTTYLGSVATVLGFADPLGRPDRNAVLSAQRATAVKAFLVGQNVAASRISAVGRGTVLPAAPSPANGAQPLDRRVVIVIDPVLS
jgi:outer membrane protein OmpA-like peptidoglycan-associated protein